MQIIAIDKKYASRAISNIQFKNELDAKDFLKELVHTVYEWAETFEVDQEKLRGFYSGKPEEDEMWIYESEWDESFNQYITKYVISQLFNENSDFQYESQDFDLYRNEKRIHFGMRDILTIFQGLKNNAYTILEEEGVILLNERNQTFILKEDCTQQISTVNKILGERKFNFNYLHQTKRDQLISFVLSSFQIKGENDLVEEELDRFVGEFLLKDKMSDLTQWSVSDLYLFYLTIKEWQYDRDEMADHYINQLRDFHIPIYQHRYLVESANIAFQEIVKRATDGDMMKLIMNPPSNYPFRPTFNASQNGDRHSPKIENPFKRIENPHDIEVEVIK